MVAKAEVAEYLEEIRKHVCSRCIERPPGGPPCAPLGKNCGVEMHLPELIDSIHQINSVWLEEYQEQSQGDLREMCLPAHQRLSVSNGLPGRSYRGVRRSCGPAPPGRNRG